MEAANKSNAYSRAEKRVKQLKEFYNHLFIYLVFLIVWILFSRTLIGLILEKVNGADQGFNDWLDINIWITPTIWGLVVIGHGIYVFTNKSNFLKNWEQEKLKEFMAEDDENNAPKGWE